MPSRNIVKEFDVQSFYHIYSRGVAKQIIFVDAADKSQFLKIVARHLDASDCTTKSDGQVYRKFDRDLELNCYCLMGNHFHLLVYQLDDPKSITELMRSVLTAYSMYFNRRHKRVGPLFESNYKSSRITTQSYLEHITRYIHLNPRTYKTYFYSSLKYYLGEKQPKWLRIDRVADMFEGESYLEFLEDYEDYKLMLDELKHELADQRYIT